MKNCFFSIHFAMDYDHHLDVPRELAAIIQFIAERLKGITARIKTHRHLCICYLQTIAVWFGNFGSVSVLLFEDWIVSTSLGSCVDAQPANPSANKAVITTVVFFIMISPLDRINTTSWYKPDVLVEWLAPKINLPWYSIAFSSLCNSIKKNK